MKNLGRIAFWGWMLVCGAGTLSADESILQKEGKPFLATDQSIMETTPVFWQGKPVLLASVRRGGSQHTPQDLWLKILDLETRSTLAEFGIGHSLASAFVEKRSDGEVFHVFAARQPENESWFRDIEHFFSCDLKTWECTPAIRNENEHLLNSSVCRDTDGYVMAYETDNPVGFCFKFARSQDLQHWEKVPDALYAGPDGKTYSACPTIRWHAPYYYVIHLRSNGRGGYESVVIRSKDLRQWEEAPCSPILSAGEGEGTNNSDVDLLEVGGKTWFFYATGDQQTWCDVRRASFNGTERVFFEACYIRPDDALSCFGVNKWTGDEKERTNIYVSKLGDDTDGKSWKTAFRTIQRGLNAVPNNQGGYRVVVRPDTYFEANLLPPFQGAKGQYNELIGDWDGRFGSGATGWVLVDSSDLERGFQSYDWYSIIRAYTQGWSKEHTGATISSLAWDRWIVRHFYVTGSDAGLFWDCLDETEPFTVLVEDCVSIGRAFGIGVAFGMNHSTQGHTRPDEPIVFRRTWAATLDRWGDAGAAFLRAVNSELPDVPDFYLEDCTLVSPDNAIENNCFEFNGSTYVALKRCRLIVMNFTQPVGNPPCTGIIRTPNEGNRYRVAMEDCELMGCKVFSQEKNTPPQYTLRGHNRVYLQYMQPIPDGMEPIHGWPTELFQHMAPPLLEPKK